MRKILDGEFEGFTWPEQFVVASTQYDFAQHGFAMNSYISDPVNWAAVFKMPHEGPPGIWRVVFPGAPDLIERRALRGPLGIVSGALEPEIVFALRKMGARDHVGFIVSAERTAASKPDPAPFLLAREELRRAGHDGPTVVVEDSLGGIASARAAGLPCVGVAHSVSPDALLRAGAAFTVADLSSLTDEVLDAAAGSPA